jgi:acyl-ACP thioesterase
MNKIVFNRQRLLETIQQGLQNEYTKYLTEMENILVDWKNESKNSDEVFDLVFKKVFSAKKQIIHKYSHLRTSKYLAIISEQIAGGYLSKEDLNDYSVELKQTILEKAEAISK